MKCNIAPDVIHYFARKEVIDIVTPKKAQLKYMLKYALYHRVLFSGKHKTEDWIAEKTVLNMFSQHNKSKVSFSKYFYVVFITKLNNNYIYRCKT